MSGYNNKVYSTFSRENLSADEWRKFIRAGRNKNIRTCANNTSARITDENLVAIKLHNTDVVTVFSDGRKMLDSGGWQTVTTKERINRYSNAGISQKQSIWYMRDGSLFYDGMIIDADGMPVKPRMPEKHERELKKIKAQAKQYAHDFVVKLQAGEIPMPNAGDCWACYFAIENDATRRDKTKAHVAQPMGAGHLFEHIKDKYYVPSLLVNAAHDAGYRDMQVGMMGIGGQRLFIDPERNIYKYMVKYMAQEVR